MMDSWENVAGKLCCCCNGPATHEYAPGTFYCCDCHAGQNVGPFDMKKAAQSHIAVLNHRIATLNYGIDRALAIFDVIAEIKDSPAIQHGIKSLMDIQKKAGQQNGR